MDAINRSCIDCHTHGCAKESGNYPEFCPTAMLGEDAIENVSRSYSNDGSLSIMEAASEVSTEAYSKRWSRVEETIALFHRMEWKRIGIACCSGLLEEARIFAQILRVKGFEPYGIACKVGAVPKGRFNSPESCCDFGTISCNPIMQAELLNEANTDANVIIGLCAGHDMIFNAHSTAPVTTLVAKDRATFHNPVGALHGARTSTFYNHLLKPDSAECCKGD